MRYYLVYQSNYSGVWTTTNTGDDFEFHHNIIANGRTAWTRDNSSSHHYPIHELFTNNINVTGNDGGSTINNDFLKIENVQLTGTIEIEKDQSKKNYLQLKENSLGSG